VLIVAAHHGPDGQLFGTLIRHAAALTVAVGLLPIAMIRPTLRAMLMATVGFPPRSSPSRGRAGVRAIGPTPRARQARQKPRQAFRAPRSNDDEQPKPRVLHASAKKLTASVESWDTATRRWPRIRTTRRSGANRAFSFFCLALAATRRLHRSRLRDEILGRWVMPPPADARADGSPAIPAKVGLRLAGGDTLSDALHARALPVDERCRG